MSETYTDVDGEWTKQGDAWTLTTPSQTWIDARAADAAAIAAAEAALPDYNAAMLAGFIALEQLAPGTADDLLAQFPSFGFAMTAQNGPLAWSRLASALAGNKITQAQHDAVAGALTNSHIPSS